MPSFQSQQCPFHCNTENTEHWQADFVTLSPGLLKKTVSRSNTMLSLRLELHKYLRNEQVKGRLECSYMKSTQGVSRTFFYHLILRRLLLCMSWQSFPPCDTLPGHTAWGICFSYIKNSAKITIKSICLLTQHPNEIWRVKGEMRIPSQPIFGNETSGSGENAPHCIRQ